MANIHVLDQNTINKIAAGEVIERPASVVKELLENAIDAKATAVTVEIREGGISFIRVTDNGCGIPRDEIALAFLRHSTSKIKSVEDLFMVSSLGFRGEALSSIAAVSQVEVITRTPDSLVGTRYQIEGGKEKSLEEIGAPEGTTFIARNLFYNTPVRRKFLKTAMTEGAHVADLVEKIALSHPEISIRFIQNNQNKLFTSGNHNLKDIIYTVYGREIAANLLPVTACHEAVSVGGFIGKPVIARSNRNFENYFINGRYIKNKIICRAIEEAYKPFMMQHKYPFTMLQFTIEPEFLDVNVHPTKMELRFQNGELIFRVVRDALAETLMHKELIPAVSLDEKKSREEEKQLQKQNHEKRIPVPEPFERKRMAQLHPEILREEPTPYFAGTIGSAPRFAGTTAEPAAEPPAPRQETELPTVSSSPVHAQPLPIPAKQTELQQSTEQTQVSAQQDQEPAGQVQVSVQQKQESADQAQISLQQDQGPADQAQVFVQQIQVSAQQEKSVEPEQIQVPVEASVEVSVEAPVKQEQIDLFGGKLLEPKSRSRHKLIGQLFDTYWMVEFEDQLYIIDQHAAHEKVLYEKTMATLKTREYTSQMVDPPIILSLGSREEVLFKKYLKYFHDIGFEIEPFGGREYAVRGVPDNLFSIAKKELLMEMIDSLSEDTFTGNADMIYEKVASMSCKAAVKGNHRMTAAEADHLIDLLLDLENPYACPHGRPTIISMSKYELEKKFKRIV